MPLPYDWTLPEKIKERFGTKSTGRQRAMFAEGHLLIVLHRAPERDTRRRESLFFWRKPGGAWEYSGGGDGLTLFHRHLQTYSEAEERFRREYEAATNAEGYFHILATLPPLRHAAKNLHATLQAAREAVPEDRDLIDLRDWAYDIERGLDLLYEDARNALDFDIARKAEEEARLSMQELQMAHRLNVLAAIFFPITAIASIFGMNLPSGLENSPTWFFWFIFLVGIGLGFWIREWVLTGALRLPTARGDSPKPTDTTASRKKETPHRF
ncbi:MAG TPA: CorA family divalent cation transporter [Anaerolineae bacterium]|nr:CorA family divalent cation transporter [Anaerolineae bacterium]